MRYFKEILSKNKYWVVLYLFFCMNAAFMSGFEASVFQQVIDGFTAGDLALKAILLYGGIRFWCTIADYLNNWPTNKLDTGFLLDFKLLALEKISRMDYGTYRSIGTGKIMQRIENGAAAGRNILFGFWLNLFGSLLPTIFFNVLFIWRISPAITGVLLVSYALVFLVSNLLLKALYRIKERVLACEEQLNHFLVRGFMEMLVFRMERQFPGEIRKAADAKREIVNSKGKMTMVHEAFFTLFAILVILLNLSVLIYAYFSHSVTVGEAVTLITLIGNAYTPIAIFNVVFVQYKLDRAAYKRFEDFMNTPDDPQLMQGKAMRVQGDITVRNLHFAYGERVLFDRLNLHIRQGEKIAFVGESGSGKTTLLHILSGLTKYESGSVQINGQELKTVCLDSLYEQIFYVSQDSPVFDGTLRENMAFDRLLTDEKLWEALRKAELSALAEKMPAGLDTAVGERGAVLSGGEKQRLALTRLYLTEKPLVLLDEATSAMDNLTERSVMDAVLEAVKNSTVIAVAHRLSAVAGFDRIVVFNDGMIMGDGTFSELMEKNEYFRKLYQTAEET